jgi:hypothetical protein
MIYLYIKRNMKHILNDLTKNEKEKILEQHNGELYVVTSNFNSLVNNKLGSVKPFVNEDNVQGGGLGVGGRGTGYHREEVSVKVKNTYNFDKNKMKTGSDDVDITSKEYSDLIIQLRMIMKNNKIKGPINVTVTGGASSVGSSSGYDNKALANRRANKLIDQLKKDIPNITSKFKFIVKGVVGGATKLNSPEAMSQQFVKVDFDYNEMSNVKQSIELDNTTVKPYIPGMPPVKDKFDDDDIIPIPKTDKIKRVCVRIPESLLDEFRQKIREFKSENKLDTIPFGVYDVK